jgi:cytochrome c biogenesis protein CcdA
MYVGINQDVMERDENWNAIVCVVYGVIMSLALLGIVVTTVVSFIYDISNEISLTCNGGVIVLMLIAESVWKNCFKKLPEV